MVFRHAPPVVQVSYAAARGACLGLTRAFTHQRYAGDPLARFSAGSRPGAEPDFGALRAVLASAAESSVGNRWAQSIRGDRRGLIRRAALSWALVFAACGTSGFDESVDGPMPDAASAPSDEDAGVLEDAASFPRDVPSGQDRRDTGGGPDGGVRDALPGPRDVGGGFGGAGGRGGAMGSGGAAQAGSSGAGGGGVDAPVARPDASAPLDGAPAAMDGPDAAVSQDGGMGDTFAADAPLGPLRLLPLGDSITRGYLEHPSYRYFLEQRFRSAGIPYAFVGTQWGAGGAGRTYDEESFPNFHDKHHEGHGGWRSDQTAAAMETWWTSYEEPPDIVLVMIGTNDVDQNRATAAITASIGEIVGTLQRLANLANRPIKIMVAQILPFWASKFSKDAKVRELNAAIARLVNETLASPAVSVVDMYTNFDATTMGLSDGLHPNHLGDQHVAEQWWQALHDELHGKGRRSSARDP